MWEEVQHLTLDHSVHETLGLEISWQEADVIYRNDTGGVALSLTQALSLRVAQSSEDTATNSVGQDLDFFVVLADGAQAAIVCLGLVGAVPCPDAAARRSIPTWSRRP